MTVEPVNIFEYEEIARERIQKGDYDYIAGGATDEITIRRTRAVYDSIMLRPRMMVDVARRSLDTTALGQENSPARHAGSCGQSRVGPPGSGDRFGQSGGSGGNIDGAQLARLPYPGGRGGGGHRAAVVPAVFLQGPRA